MAGGAWRSKFSELSKQPGALQDLLRQWKSRGVMTTQELKSFAGMASRDAVEEAQKVVDHIGREWLACDVDQPSAWHPK